MISAAEALDRLSAGNDRFVASVRAGESLLTRSQPTGLVREQSPFAIILGCSDARVPAEIVFDQGLGELFVIRVAGNIVAPSQIGSVEFAASNFGTPLVVVLGHAKCGAVIATLDQLRQPVESQSPNLRSIVDRVRPAVEGLLPGSGDEAALVAAAVQANVRTSVEQLRHGSEIVEQLIGTGDLTIVGAEYDLDTGRVEFLD